MSTSTEFQTRRFWLPIPALAFRAQAIVAADSELDALEITLLRLLRLAARDLHELVRLVNFPEDMVVSALNQLVDRHLVASPGKGAELFEAVDLDASLHDGGDVVPGWVFFTGHDLRFLPRLWTERRLPRPSEFAEGILEIDERDRPRIHAPKWEDAADLIARLVCNKQILTAPPSGPITDEATPGFGPSLDEETTEAEPPPLDLPNFSGADLLAGESRIQSLLLDQAEYRRHKPRTARCWAAVDLIPQISGRAQVIFHEPDILPGLFPDRQISDVLGPWLEREMPSLVKCIDDEAEQMRIDFSEVLRIAGIHDPEELEREVKDWQRRRGCRFELPPGASPMTWAVVESITQAQKWLILSRRFAPFQTAALHEYEHAIEKGLKVLGDHAIPTLREFQKREERRRKEGLQPKKKWTDAEVRDRLSALGLEGRLTQSMKPLQETLSRLKLADELDEDRRGVGANLILWLLPLVLLEDHGAALDYAGPIKAAVTTEPRLFEYLDDLIKIRNKIAHERDREADATFQSVPEIVDEKLCRAWTALLAALDVSAPEDAK